MKNKNILICLFLTACGSSASKVEYQADAGGMEGMADANQPGSPDARMEVADATLVSPDAMTCTADIMNDRNNCGACGHGCLESTCSNGRCIARTVTEFDVFDKMGDYYTDQTNIYFSAFKKGMTQNPNNLWKKGIDSSIPSVALAVLNQNTAVPQFAVSGPSFWLPNRLGQFNDGAIIRLSISGASSVLVKDLVESTTSNTMFYGDFIYWASGATGNGAGSIKKISVNGGEVSTVTTTPTGKIDQMMTDGTNIYFDSNSEGLIKKVSISSGPVETLFNGASVMIDNTNLYFSAPSTPTSPPSLKSAPLSGGPAVTFIDIPGVYARFNDGDWIYGVQATRGTNERSIIAIPKSNPENIITMVRTPSIQLNDDCSETYSVENPKAYGQYLYFTVAAYKSCRSTNRTTASFYIERVAKM